MQRLLLLTSVALALSGCATAPKTTVAQLNRQDPEYRSRDCRQARGEANRFDENRNGRMVLAMAANVVVPFAGTAAAAAMTKLRDDTKRDINHRVRAACTSDPLARR